MRAPASRCSSRRPLQCEIEHAVWMHRLASIFGRMCCGEPASSAGRAFAGKSSNFENSIDSCHFLLSGVVAHNKYITITMYSERLCVLSLR